MTRIVVGTKVGSRTKPETERLAERLAFNDPDRTTPIHDDICLWLDAKLRDPDWLELVVQGGPKTWNKARIANESSIGEACREGQLSARRETIGRGPGADTYTKNRYDEACLEEIKLATSPIPEPPDFGSPDLGRITWEKTIGDERWTSGFIDVAATGSRTGAIWLRHHGYHDRYRDHSHPCYAWGPEWVVEDADFSLAFEVKSAIPSLGELIRQVRYYESKHPATYFVAAPDDSHVQTLLAQRIGFVRYPDGAVFRPA